MPESIAKTTKPDDFTVLESYTNKEGDKIEGEFPVFVAGVSLCCKDSTGYIKPVPILIPKQ